MSVKIENLATQTTPNLYSGYTVYDDGTQSTKLQLNRLKTLITSDSLPLTGKTSGSITLPTPTFTGDVVVQNNIMSSTGELNISSTDPITPDVGVISINTGGLNVIVGDVTGNFTDGSLNNSIVLGTRGHGFQTEIKGDLVMLRTNSVTGGTEYDITLNQSGVFNMTGATSVIAPTVTGTTDNTKKVATTEFVQNVVSLKSNKIDPTFTGVVKMSGATSVSLPFNTNLGFGGITGYYTIYGILPSLPPIQNYGEYMSIILDGGDGTFTIYKKYTGHWNLIEPVNGGVIYELYNLLDGTSKYHLFDINNRNFNEFSFNANPTFTGDVVVQNNIMSSTGELNISSTDPITPDVGVISINTGGLNVIVGDVTGNFTDGSLNNSIVLGTRGHGFQTEIKGDLVMLRTNSVTGGTEYDITLNQSGVFNMTGATSVILPTGTTIGGHNIKPYEVYSGIFNQTGTTEPNVTILENTIGTITWSYLGVGQYRGTLSGATFTINKTVSPQDSSFMVVSSANLFINRDSNTTLYLSTADSNSGDGADNCLTDKFIEIRVYN